MAPLTPNSMGTKEIERGFTGKGIPLGCFDDPENKPNLILTAAQIQVKVLM